MSEDSLGLAVEVRRIALDAGVEIIGFGDVQEALPPGFVHLPVGISMGVAHPAAHTLRYQPEALPPEEIYWALTDHRDRHGRLVLNRAMRRIAAFLKGEGYRYFCCPTHADPMDSPFSSSVTTRFSHKAAATCAGLGWVGRHGLLNHPVYGPHVIWATLLTSAPLDTAVPVTESRCGDCHSCVDSCPGQAISGRPWRRADGLVSLVDGAKCRWVLQRNERTLGRGVCGRCAVACTMVQLGAGG